MTRFVEANVKHGSRVITDEHRSYTDLMEYFRHRVVNHSIGQYVKGRRCPHQHRGVSVVDVQARLRRHLPPHVLQAHGTAT